MAELCLYDGSLVHDGRMCALDATVPCRPTCVYFDAELAPSQTRTLTRKPVIGPGPRHTQVFVQVNKAEIQAVDRGVIARRCQSRQDYLRYLIEADAQGNLLIIDDAFKTFCEAVGRGFGGAAAELTAEADAYRLKKLAD